MTGGGCSFSPRRRGNGRRRTGYASIMAVAAAVVARSRSADRCPRAPRRRPPTTRPAATTSFELTGDVTGIYPNATVVAPVRVHNSEQYALTVESTQVLIGDAAAGCDASNLTARAVGPPVVVAAGGVANIPIQVHMLASAPDACQGATFPLTFVAEGVVDDGSTNGSPIGSTNGSADGSAPSAMPFTGAGRGLMVLLIAGTAALLTGWVLLAARRNPSKDRPA